MRGIEDCDMHVVSFDYMPLVRINAPEWYKNKQWMKWLNSGECATWHKEGQPPNEYSDVFFMHLTGSGEADYPDKIRKQLDKALEDRGIMEALIWVSNLEGG